MTDTDLPDLPELRELIAADPLPPDAPDLGPLRAAGRRRLRARRAGIVGLSAAAVAAVTVPVSLLAGGGTAAQDPTPAASSAAPVVPAAPPGQECGPLMCSAPSAPAPDEEEQAEVTGSLVTGVLPDGGEEIVYVTHEAGADDTMVDVLKIGHRRHGAIDSGVWALQPGADGPVRFWSEFGGRVNEPAGSASHFVVIGYVDGTPDEITWSTPDGASGAVDGTSTDLVEGRTVFYLSLPKQGGEPAVSRDDQLRSLGAVITRNGGQYAILADGSVYRLDQARGYVIDGSRGFDPTGLEQVDPAAVGITADEIESARARATAAPVVTPELTIHTSGGWSCSLAVCGSSG